MKNMRKAIQLLVDHGADVSYSYYGCRPVHIVVSKLRLFQSGGPGGAILDIFLKKVSILSPHASLKFHAPNLYYREPT